MSKSVESDTLATPTVLIHNERTRVTRWTFPTKGVRTGWHRHAYDYVVIPEFTGVLEIDSGGDETSRSELREGVPYFRNAGVEHDVINGNDFACNFIEVEFLT
jgi:quercetin dioxygenase-like cupin family protein